MLVYIPVGIGFNVVVGNLGQLAFSNVAFFGIGAYTSGILMLKLGLPWWATIIPAGVMGGHRRLRSEHTGAARRALVLSRHHDARLRRTHALELYPAGESLTGGSMGMAVPAADFFGWKLDTEWHKFYVFLAIAVVMAIADRSTVAIAHRPCLHGHQGQRDGSGGDGHCHQPLFRPGLCLERRSSSASAARCLPS